MFQLSLSLPTYKELPYGRGEYYILDCPACGERMYLIEGTETVSCKCRMFEIEFIPGLGHLAKGNYKIKTEFCVQPS